MAEIYSVTVQIKGRSKLYPAGQVAYGRYVIDGNVITLTDPDGHPVEDQNGKRYSAKLDPGFTPIDAEIAAGRLTRQFRNMLLGIKPPSSDRVTRPLKYPKLGLW